MDFQTLWAEMLLRDDRQEICDYCCELEQKLNSGEYSEEDCCLLKRRIRIIKDYLADEQEDDRLI